MIAIRGRGTSCEKGETGRDCSQGGGLALRW